VGLKKRVDILASMPIETISTISLQKKLAEINQTA
jgi:hypothetical protein